MRSSIKAAIAGISLLSIVSLTACASGVTGTAAAGAAAIHLIGRQDHLSQDHFVEDHVVLGGTATTSSSTPTTTAPATVTSPRRPVLRRARPNSGATATIDDDTLSSGVTIDELVDDMYGAQDIVDTFWATHWSEYYTGTYQPPTVRGLYDGTDPADTPTCDGVPLQVENAYYCASEDYVAWDATLLVEGADQIGDSWVYLVVAREWAQAMQARLDPSLLATGEQLQADCLAAAALFGAQADGTLEIEPGDESELIGSLTALADSSPVDVVGRPRRPVRTGAVVHPRSQRRRQRLP